jgi:hypothetical protein
MLCIKLEINQGYTTMHGQPIIKAGKFMLATLERMLDVNYEH